MPTISGMIAPVMDRLEKMPSSARPQPLRTETPIAPTVAMPQIHLECVSNEERSGVSLVGGRNLANEEKLLITSVVTLSFIGINRNTSV